MLDPDQKAIIDQIPTSGLWDIVDDIRSKCSAMSPTFFFLGMSPPFRRPNAVPGEVLDYCLEVLKGRMNQESNESGEQKQ